MYSKKRQDFLEKQTSCCYEGRYTPVCVFDEKEKRFLRQGIQSRNTDKDYTQGLLLL